MWRAFEQRDASYDGVFYTGVLTTGIFCLPSCPARKPLRENTRFFATAREAITAGFRPCLRCRPLDRAGEPPAWVGDLLDAIEQNPRLRDRQLRERGLDPDRVRRWFVRHYGMTFQAFLRAKRLGGALRRLQHGTPQTAVAFESGYESLSGFRDAYQQTFGTTPGKGSTTTMSVMHQFDTPLGAMVTICSNEGVLLLEFLERRALETELKELGRKLDTVIVPGENEVSRQLVRELGEYFAGERRTFDVPVRPVGTPFQLQAWRALMDIPYGETRSYLDQARAIGRPTATRAVARANGDNRIAIVIPCHRVIGANGKLTGYGGGLWRKQYLLNLETTLELAQSR